MRVAEVSIEVHPRIHLGLISLHNDALRKNGGIGFALNAPHATVEVVSAGRTEVIDDRVFKMSITEKGCLLDVVERFIAEYKLKHLPSIRIMGEMRTHVGMGSGTAIRLGVIEGIALLNEIQLSPKKLIKLSERGGTSGIGIHTYFDGGFTYDLGVLTDAKSFAPSSRIKSEQVPIKLGTLNMPDWPMAICIPRAISSKTQQEEANFFSRTTPIEAAASYEASYVALFEIYASILECNYGNFCKGVSNMQKTFWKNAEISQYDSSLKVIIDTILNMGADCVGMSSLGPMLYVFAKNGELKNIVADSLGIDCDVYMTTPRNSGRTVQIKSCSN